MGLITALQPNPTVTHFPSVNSFTIAGFRLPGKWVLESAPKKYGWQIQQGYGLSGAIVFPKGDELIVARFKGQLWQDVQKTQFDDVRKRLLIKPTYIPGSKSPGAVNALGIDHPELKALGVTAVVVGEITPLKDAGGGLWECTIDFIQYRPPLPAPAPPTQVIPDTTRNPVDTAINNADTANSIKLTTLNALKGRGPT